MKIAITASSPALEADVNFRFGRCQYFIIIDPETMQFEALENADPVTGSGAGVSTAQIIIGKGIEAVLTGNCGPNAYQALSAAGIKVITGVSGKITDAIKDCKAGNLQAAGQPNVSAHSGMNTQTG